VGLLAQPPWADGEPPERSLGRVRRALHAAGWALALAALVDAVELRGAHACALAPPRARGGGSPGPAQLELPAGRVPHEFLRTTPAGERVEAERFETIRPDALIALPPAGPSRARADLLIELDDRWAGTAWTNKLERYDHFLAGWRELTGRYRRGARVEPLVVFVCRDRPRARECARRADLLLCACRAYAGDYPQSWEYPGRRAILFVAERDLHEGRLDAWGVAALPPSLRAQAPSDGPDAAAATAVPGALPIARDRVS
jgi:hypothetical protein